MARLLALVQAAVYAILAWELSRRSTVDAGCLLAAAAAQIGVALRHRHPRQVAGLAAAALIGVLVPWGRFVWVVLHVKATVGPETGAQMLGTLGATVVVIPWVLALPLYQLVRAGWGRVGVLAPMAVTPGVIGPIVAPPEPLDPLAYHAKAPKRTRVVPGIALPAPPPDDRRWSAPPALDAAAIDDSVAAAVHHLAVNLAADGRYTYIVKAPEGVPGPGYNYPRHAGTTWFLARSAQALATTRPDAAAEALDAGLRALGHLQEETRRTDDGRAFVIDPTRRDGKAWIGTTALAALAIAALPADRVDPALRDGWARQLAASVDTTGKVRGEMDIATGAFPDQAANPYGQGQTLLALAALARSGVAGVDDALARAAAYVDGPYYGTAHPLATGDEHWICLATHVVAEVTGTPSGRGVCASYVATERWNAPVDGGGLPPAAGPAGGAAEAVVAHAWDTGDPALAEVARRYGNLFLQNQYRDADAPLLARPERLVGGYRDDLGALDVQIDAVQHIGSALLGIEAVITGRARPGSFP